MHLLADANLNCVLGPVVSIITIHCSHSLSRSVQRSDKFVEDIPYQCRSVCAKGLSMFKDQDAFFFRVVMCGRKVSFLSKITCRNLHFFYTGSVAFRCKVGSVYKLRFSENMTATIFCGENWNPFLLHKLLVCLLSAVLVSHMLICWRACKLSEDRQHRLNTQ